MAPLNPSKKFAALGAYACRLDNPVEADSRRLPTVEMNPDAAG